MGIYGLLRQMKALVSHQKPIEIIIYVEAYS